MFCSECAHCWSCQILYGKDMDRLILSCSESAVCIPKTAFLSQKRSGIFLVYLWGPFGLLGPAARNSALSWGTDGESSLRIDGC